MAYTKPAHNLIGAVMEMGTIAVTSGDATHVVALLGEHDISTEPELRRALDVPFGKRVIADLTRATFIDSTVIRSLIDANDGDLAVIIAPGTMPARVWELVGLTDKIPTYPSRATRLVARPATGRPTMARETSRVGNTDAKSTLHLVTN